VAKAPQESVAGLARSGKPSYLGLYHRVGHIVPATLAEHAEGGPLLGRAGGSPRGHLPSSAAARGWPAAAF